MRRPGRHLRVYDVTSLLFAKQSFISKTSICISTKECEIETELRWQAIGMVKRAPILLLRNTISESSDEEGYLDHLGMQRDAAEKNIYAQES